VVVPMLRASLFSSGVIVAALGALGRSLAHRRAAVAPLAAFALAAFTVPLLWLRWAEPLRAYAASASSRQLAATILASPERDLPVYGYYYFRTSLPFYLGRPVGLVTAGASETTSNYIASRWQELRRETLPDGRSAAHGIAVSASLPALVDGAGLEALARSSAPFLILARNVHVAEIARVFGRAELVWTAWDYSILEVSSVPPGGRAAGEQRAVMIDKVLP